MGQGQYGKNNGKGRLTERGIGDEAIRIEAWTRKNIGLDDFKLRGLPKKIILGLALYRGQSHAADERWVIPRRRLVTERRNHLRG